MVSVAGRREGQTIIRQRFIIGGIVQGVGFRPFVYRLARGLGLNGWVRNSPAGVEIEAQGAPDELSAFGLRLTGEAPPLASIASITFADIPLSDADAFSILPSSGGVADIQVAPDSALCSDCLRELFAPDDRRYRYPFITCTNCGPRYSIITGIPYDRPKTTMAGFPMCPACLGEYHDPSDRRFHAQPNACPVCGPQLRLLDKSGKTVAERDEALMRAVALLKEGSILAVKGIGGYHLAANACDNGAVGRLRQRKRRDEKPFAVMVADLDVARSAALLSDQEERLLTSPEAPVVIVRKAPACQVSPLVAPNNDWLGLMLPYTPLHHLLFHPSSFNLQPLFTALVMTSANISDEPVAFEDAEALGRLSGIADFFLVHDRPIHVRNDDSVLRVFQDKPLFYRRARGYAPRSVRLPYDVPPILAVGAELKGAVCLAQGERAFLSQHIGDLQNSQTYDSFCLAIEHLAALLLIEPGSVACDLHPDYLSSVYASESGLPLIRVQHHHAHMAACMAEHGLDGDLIGVVFDGTGFGADGTVWGGEFLVGGYDGFQRAAHFRAVPLPGGDAAVREPWRMALAYLHQAYGEGTFALDHPVARCLADTQRSLFDAMLVKGINTPLTSSCGRLFDAVAALLGIRHNVTYDGQAAIELEALAETMKDDGVYPCELTAGDNFQINFAAMFPSLLDDLASSVPLPVIARRFHATVAKATVEACVRIAGKNGLTRIVLSGGVFQNRLLSEMVYTGLIGLGLQVFTHRLVPPNDGGIALGQAAIAGRQLKRGI